MGENAKIQKCHNKLTKGWMVKLMELKYLGSLYCLGGKRHKMKHGLSMGYCITAKDFQEGKEAGWKEVWGPGTTKTDSYQ